MVDLNLWRLKYDDVELEFGTHDSGHPFTRQVVVGAAELEAGDLAHPLSNGMMFGRDYSRGRVLEFAGAHLSTMAMPDDERRWTPIMDDGERFAGAWAAEKVRETVGKMATLANIDRRRLVYGRPRPYTPDLELARKGWLTYACQFATVDDRFYGLDEKVVAAGIDPGTSYALAFPLSFPHQATTPSITRAWVDNAGSVSTWPVVTFRNTSSRPRVDFHNDSGGVDWWLKIDRVLDHNDEVVIDCRPWARTVTINGNDASGKLRGTPLGQCRIPPGLHELTLETVDPTGLAEVEVRWRDGFGSL